MNARGVSAPRAFRIERDDGDGSEWGKKDAIPLALIVAGEV
jgi:hypothetical protein